MSEMRGSGFIPPDYSDAIEKTADDILDCPTDDDIDLDDIDEDVSLTENDEEIIHADPINAQQKENERIMASTPFLNPNPAPSFGGGSTGSPVWGNNSGSSFWGNQPTKQSWGGGSSSLWGTSSNSSFGGQKQQINRNKKVIFCDFLDCIVETKQSNGRPGLRPRDIYDLQPKFEVWERIAAFNPDRIYMLISNNLIPASANGINSWNITLSYFCCCLSSFIRLPFERCQILKQGRLDQSKAEVISSILDQRDLNIRREDSVMIGIYSGVNGLSDLDVRAASMCNLDYIDINQLLNNMI